VRFGGSAAAAYISGRSNRDFVEEVTFCMAEFEPARYYLCVVVLHSLVPWHAAQAAACWRGQHEGQTRGLRGQGLHRQSMSLNTRIRYRRWETHAGSPKFKHKTKPKPSGSQPSLCCFFFWVTPPEFIACVVVMCDTAPVNDVCGQAAAQGARGCLWILRGY
jgi:hypothetical protein